MFGSKKHIAPTQPWRFVGRFSLAMKKVQLLQRGSHLSSLPELPATHGEWGMPHGSATGCQQDLFHDFHRLHTCFRVVNSQKRVANVYRRLMYGYTDILYLLGLHASVKNLHSDVYITLHACMHACMHTYIHTYIHSI